MAKAKDHLALANKNQQALDYLIEKADKFPEWVCITAFYKAVQVAEAMFVHDNGRNCHDHGNRLRRLKTGKYQALYKHFRVLWSASTVARYLEDNDENGGTYSSFSDYMQPFEVTDKIVVKRLITFEGLTLQFLSDQMQGELNRARVQKSALNSN